MICGGGTQRDSGEHGHGVEVVEGGRQLETVEEKGAAALRSRFAGGGDAARHRGKWLLVKARNDAGLARLESDHVESLRSVLGGTGLPQCLMTAWFGRKCEASKEMQTDGGLAVVGSSVRVFKAKPDECFGDKSQYIAFGVGDRSRPCIEAKLQRDARKEAMATAATAPSSSSTTAPPPPPPPAPPPPPLPSPLLATGATSSSAGYKHRRKSAEAAVVAMAAAMAVDEESGSGDSMDEAQQPQQPVAPLQRRGPPTGRFLKLNEGLRLAVSELAGENTELMRENLTLRQQAEAAQAETHTTAKRNQRLENEASAMRLALEKAKEGSEEAAAAAQKGQATRAMNRLLEKHRSYITASEAASASLRDQLGQRKLELAQAEKASKWKDRQVSSSAAKASKTQAKADSTIAALEAKLAAADAKLAAEGELRRHLEEEHNDESLVGAARVLLTGEELDDALRIPSLASLGASCSSMDQLGPRRRADMGRIVGMLLGRVLEIAYAGGGADPKQVLQAALSRRGASATTLGIAMAQEGGEEKRMAKLHARSAFPGAEPEARTNPHSGITPERAAYVADFLRRKDNVKQVEANTSKRVQWALTARRWRPWRKLRAEMEARQMKPASWPFFWALTSTPQYVLLKYDTCCCGICRGLGFDNYDELRAIITELDLEIKRASSDARSLPLMTQLLARVDKEEEFRRGSYLSHLQNESSCGSHCLRMLLSTYNDPAFKSPCSHPPPESGAGEEPKTMVELVHAAHGRKPQPSDWHHTCESCGAAKGRSGQSNALMCTHCEAIVHPACLATWHNDQPGKEEGGSWTCPVCVRDIDEQLHAPDCAQCAEASFITSDVRLGINLLERLEQAPPSSSPPPSSSSSPSPPHTTPSFRHVTASEFLKARLSEFANKEDKYHGHLIQDRNQDVYKEVVLENMGFYSFYMLVDYWAKLAIVKPGGAACCEGDSVRISAHGAMFVYKNPTTDVREEISGKYGGIDWSEFPPPPDKGGGEFCEEHAAAYCDDAKQDQFHTKSVMEATVVSFCKARPWLGDRRRSFGQSDNASNYRDPTIEVDCYPIGTRCFSVAGMGKDEGDGNNGVIKRQLRAMRDGPDGRSFMCAADYTEASRTLKTTGQNYGEMKVSRSSSVQVVDRKSFPRHYHALPICGQHRQAPLGRMRQAHVHHREGEASARETIHKEPRFVMPREVEEWLRENAYDHEQGRDKLRPYVAYSALKAHFAGCLRNDTGTPMALDRDRVAKWIAEQKAEEKTKRRLKRAADKMKEEPSKGKKSKSSSSSSSSGKSKKAAKAKKPTKRKREKPSVKDGDEDDDGSDLSAMSDEESSSAGSDGDMDEADY